MHPILFEIPGLGFPVRSFGVMVALGFILATWIFGRLVARYSDDPERDVPRYSALPVWVLVGVMAGARLLYVIVEIARGSPTGEQYLSEPWTMLAIWEGGLVMYGGLFGGIAAGAWCCRRQGIGVPHAADLGLTASFFGLAVGRIGCLLVGDDYGKLVPPAWRGAPFPITVRVPEPLPPHSLFPPEHAGELLWATQPWMFANALVIGLAGLWLIPRRRYAGQVALVVSLWYALTRFAIEAFRGDEVRGTWFGGAVSTSQLISAVVAICAVGLLVAARRRGTALQA